MDNATLVGLDIQAGLSIVAALEKANVAPKVALWMMTPEHEDGRLVIASPSLDQSRPMLAYEKVADVLRDISVQARPPITILRMRDPFIQTLRHLFSKTTSIEGMRLGGQTIGNRFISEAYVYKIQ